MEERLDSEAFSADDIVRDRALGPDDPDALRHAPIAALVAELVASGATPLNIALYGAWGSGKSSFFSLLKGALKARKESIAIVRYDAWKYSGQALQRNFISEAADQLKVGSRRFRQGLYEAREEEVLDVTGLDWRQARDIFIWAAKWLAPIVLLGVAIYVGALGLVAAVTDVGFSKELARIPATFLAPSIIAAALVAGGRLLLAESRSTVQVAPPEEEQLEGAFKALLEAAVKRRTLPLGQRKYERFVFFIDELDRCEPEEVVATLSAVKHFLDQPNCVFIVAADRDVLEKALTELPQSNPTNEESPYYSSASEFLDKVFHTQLSLPPLREQRLTRFARDLVLEKSRGLWHELATDPKRLSEVIYAVIPPHVRSPRRAKILLTNFALNARIADARDLDWRARAPEIAKLTVFQTEFPLFADDLHLEPRLPELLLDDEPGELSPRAERLLARHRVPAAPRVDLSAAEPSEESAASEEATEEEPAERPLEETGRLLTSEKHRVLVHSQREQLRRYLETRRAIQNPRADLLYLEGIGAAVDLEDAVLAELVETSSRDEPETVIHGLDGRDAQELRKAARVLALMVSQEFGIEQQNVMSILLHVVSELDENLGDVTDEVLGGLRRFVDDGQTIPEEHLLGAFIAATLAEQADDRSFTADLFADDRLLEDSDRVKEVAFRLPRLSDEHQDLVRARVAQSFAEDEDVLYEPLSVLPEQDAVALLDAAFNEGVRTEIRRLDESGDHAAAREVAEGLFESIEDRDTPAPTLLRRAEWMLLTLDSAASYAPVRERAERILGLPENVGYRNGHGCEGIRRGPPADWKFWAGMLSRDGSFGEQTSKAVAAIRSIIPRVAEAPEDDQAEAPDVVRAVIQTVKLEPSEDAPLSEVAEDLRTALAQRQWWANPDLRRVQENIHRIAHELLTTGGPLKEEVSQILLEDIDRAFGFGASSDAIEGAVTMGTALDVSAMRQVAERLVGAAGSYPTDTVRARLQLAHAAKRAGEKPTEESPLNVSRDEVRAAANEDATVIKLWLDLKPPLADAEPLAVNVRESAPAATIEAFASYSKKLSPAQRSKLILALVDEDFDASNWIEALARNTFDEQAVVEPLVEGALQASRAEQRATYIKNLVALRPREPSSARRVADLVVGLLEKRQAADFDNALAALPALGPDHRSKERLQNAFRTACEALDRKVPARWADEFERVRLSLPKRYFAESRSRKIRRFLGRR